MKIFASCLLVTAMLAGCGSSQDRDEAPVTGDAAQAAPVVHSETPPAAATPAAHAPPAATSTKAAAPEAGAAVPAPPFPKENLTPANDLALNAVVTASTTHSGDPGEGGLEALVDGDMTTRWASAYHDHQLITLDLLAVHGIAAIELAWERAAAKSYEIDGSLDAKVWTTLVTKKGGVEGPRRDVLPLTMAKARYLRIKLTERATKWGFSLYEIIVRPQP